MSTSLRTTLPSASPFPDASVLRRGLRRHRVRRGIRLSRARIVRTTLSLALMGMIVGCLLAPYEVSVSIIHRDGAPAADGDDSLIIGGLSDDGQSRIGTLFGLYSDTACETANSGFGRLTSIRFLGVGRGELLARANRLGGIALDRLREQSRLHGEGAAAELDLRAGIGRTELDRLRERLMALRSRFGIEDVESEREALLTEKMELERGNRALVTERSAIAAQLTALEDEMRRRSPELAAARRELDIALGKYTEAHPRIIELRHRLEALEKAASRSDVGIAAAPPPGGSAAGATIYDRILSLRMRGIDLDERFKASGLSVAAIDKRLDELASGRIGLASLEEEIAGALAGVRERSRSVVSVRAETDAAGDRFQILAPAATGDLRYRWKAWTGISLALLMGTFGAVTAAVRGIRRHANGRIQDLEEAGWESGLAPVASLETLSRTPAAERRRRAMEAFTRIRGLVGAGDGRGIVLGVTASASGEGTSTVIDLLADAATRTGYRVMVVVPTLAGGSASILRHPGRASTNIYEVGCDDLDAALEVVRGLSDDRGRPRIRTRVEEWVWKPDARAKWRQALAECGRMENLVVLVDLPAASNPETPLLVEGLPHLLWVMREGRTRVEELKNQLKTMENMKTGICGFVYNAFRGSTARWRRAAALMALMTGLGGVLAADAQETGTVTGNAGDGAGGTFSVASSVGRASWQERLELGPGDVINIEIFESPETRRSGVTIGPDGRINYLQARDFVAAGMTIDELRSALDNTLERYYRAPRTVVTPVGFFSKKYFILGNVVQKGVYPLDRPVTVVEAIARASGFVTEYRGANQVLRADLSRSFLMRGEDRVKVDFEQLFLNGALTNNIPLEPDDYLYFAPKDVQEIYVVGEVGRPGVLPMEPDLSLIRALAQAGGFSDRAYKQRILVIRGSLNRPQTFVVSANDVLKARAPDFKLEAGDIVYVHSRPWILAEELLELGIKSFIRGAVIQWTGDNVDLVDKPFLR